MKTFYKDLYLISVGAGLYVLSAHEVSGAETIEAVYDVIIKSYYYSIVEGDLRHSTGHRIEKVLMEMVAERVREHGRDCSWSSVVID